MMRDENKVRKEKKEKKKRNKGKRRLVSLQTLFIAAIIVTVLTLQLSSSLKDVRVTETDITYKEFMSELDNGNIQSITIYDSVDYCTVIKNDNSAVKIPNPKYPEFKKDIMERGVTVVTQKKNISQAIFDFIIALPLYLFLMLIALYLANMLRSFSDSIFKKVKKENTVKFDDVAGLSEVKRDIQFAVNTLKNSKELSDSGARGVKGIMLYGPPGTGKTLIARAIAGEAGVPFISTSGSDFSNMYVGVGAQRIRQLYSMAVANAPCVVFIDEIDALAKKRTYGSDVSSEFSGTLNALLQRIDGLSSNTGILFVAATNMIEVIDPAILRYGRFDRQIYVGIPVTKKDREEIIKVHIRNKKLEDGESVESISKFFFGMTGAQIEGILNESVLESINGGRCGIISIRDIDNAVMKMESKGVISARMGDKEREVTAVHEAGHAVISSLLGKSISKVSIISYGDKGGVTVINHGDEEMTKMLYKESEIIDLIKIRYGGLCAEEIMFEEHSSGCSSDIQFASKLISDMVQKYGMGDSLLAIDKDNELWRLSYGWEEEKRISEAIKNEVLSTLKGHRNDIIELRDRLLEEEVVYDYSIGNVSDSYQASQNKPE